MQNIQVQLTNFLPDSFSRLLSVSEKLSSLLSLQTFQGSNRPSQVIPFSALLVLAKEMKSAVRVLDNMSKLDERCNE